MTRFLEGWTADVDAELDPHRAIETARHRMDRFSTVLLISFGLAVLAIMAITRSNITIDMAVVIAGVLALILGRGLQFVKDWAPFLAMLLAWQLMRGIAVYLGGAVHSDQLIAADRAIAFGIVPTVELQKLFWSGTPGLHDYLLSLVYVAHFGIPVGVGFALWLRRRRVFYPFVVALLLVSYAAFVTFVLYPAAPPRFSGFFGVESLPVADIMAHTGTAVDWAGSEERLSGNPVAAFPSMHAAYPLLATIFLWPVWRRAAWAMAVWTVLVWFAVIYLGHHYLVDVIGGSVYAFVGIWVVMRFWPRGRRPAPNAA